MHRLTLILLAASYLLANYPPGTVFCHVGLKCYVMSCELSCHERKCLASLPFDRWPEDFCSWHNKLIT